MSLLVDVQDPAGSLKKEDGMGLEDGMESGVESGAMEPSTMEPSTMPWPDHRKMGKGDRLSIKSDASLREAVSWTESERELMVEREEKVGNGGGGKEEGAGSRAHLEDEEEEPSENHLPEKAAQVFNPAVTVLNSPSSPRESEAFWEMGSEKSPFISPRGDPNDFDNHGYLYEWSEERPPGKCGCGQGCSSRDTLKIGVSLMTSALFFPLLVWGGYVFLPFDAPLLDGAPLRLVYTLRCSVFAAVPIVLGWLVLGISRLRSAALGPFYDSEEKEAGFQEVTVHRRFISDSASLFLIYFVQLVVMAMYLSQEQLKLVPLLTVVFALGRLVYWVAAAFGSSVRGFGFGLSFLPSVAMMVANIYFMFSVEAGGSIFSVPPPPEEVLPPPGRQRFWG
ncbi:transmembrane protein 79-like [Cheilinus undulatus]|uniref:transmembrane protein 79-like n=1 Tax=Cheilinus undulatus TaxID=241271 RepID=UPI001BD4B208|nr:transmembrane protein 79-like [Cheilinus undulatus]XP_041649816.1 transmembrane protein 79-like [Cheilinus undulatus]